MPTTRKVHRFHASARDYNAPDKLEKEMNASLANGERVTAVVYEDGSWFVFTDNHGLSK